jgi:hypothetical protein
MDFNPDKHYCDCAPADLTKNQSSVTMMAQDANKAVGGTSK